MTICGDRCAVKETLHEAYAKRLHCHRWSCPDCNPYRRKRLIAEIMSGKPSTLLTFTYRAGDELTPAEQLTRLLWAIRICLKRYMRRSRLSRLPRYSVVEGTKAGTPHVHILLRGVWLDQAWLSSQMQELIDAPIVDIRRIDSAGRAAKYVSKYVGKDPRQFGTHKRYHRSKDWRIEPKPEKPAQPLPGQKWERHSFHISKWFRSQLELRWTPVWLTPDLVHSRAPP